MQKNASARCVSRRITSQKHDSLCIVRVPGTLSSPVALFIAAMASPFILSNIRFSSINIQALCNGLQMLCAAVEIFAAGRLQVECALPSPPCHKCFAKPQSACVLLRHFADAAASRLRLHPPADCKRAEDVSLRLLHALCMGIYVPKMVISELAARPAESHPTGRPCQRMVHIIFQFTGFNIHAVQVRGDTVPVRCFM